MSTSDHHDPLWNQAWEWVVRMHEQPLDPSVQEQLIAWLSENPAHRAAYEEASQVWLASALIPPDT